MRHRGFEPDYTLETLEKKGAFRVAYISVTKSVTHKISTKKYNPICKKYFTGNFIILQAQ